MVQGRDGANDGFDVGAGDASGAEKNRLRLGERQDSGFDADLAGTSVEDEIDVVAEAAADVLGSGGGKFGEAVGTGSGEGHVGGTDESERDGMGWHAEGDGRKSGGDGVGNRRLLPNDERQRAGPEFSGQTIGSFWPICDQRLCHFDRSYVNDERAEGRATFDGIDSSDGVGVERVGSKSVDGFGRERDETTGAEEGSGVEDLFARGSLGHETILRSEVRGQSAEVKAKAGRTTTEDRKGEECGFGRDRHAHSG